MGFSVCTYIQHSYGCVCVLNVCVCVCVCACVKFVSTKWDAGRGPQFMYTYIEHVPICVGVCMHVYVYVYVHVYPQRVGRGSWVAVDIYLVEPRSGYKAIVLRLSVYVCVFFV